MPELTEAEWKTLSNAERNLNLNRGIEGLPTNHPPGTPEDFAAKFGRSSSQLDVLMNLRAKVAALPPDGPHAAVLSDTLERFDQEITHTLSSLRDLSARSGVTNDQQIAQLRSVQMLAGQHANTAGVLPSSLQSARDLQHTLQSEIYTRQSPGFDQLVVPPDHREYEGNLQSVENAINSRRMMGQFIREDATTVLSREPTPEALAQVRGRTLELQARHQALTEKMSPESFGEAQMEINRIRMGSSDTIQGKSGGGERVGGASQAEQNWLEAAERATQIAHSGRPITLEQIRELNEILNHNMPANDGVPGQFRAKTETAGGGSQYPYPEDVPKMMEEFTRWFEENQHRDPIELAGLSYQKLVSIHPFDDANGRTCRLVVDSILQSKGLPPASYKGTEVNLAAFGQPQGGRQNVTPDQAIQTVATAVERSVGVMHRHRLGIDRELDTTHHLGDAPSPPLPNMPQSHPGPSTSPSSSSQSHQESQEETPHPRVRDSIGWTRGGTPHEHEQSQGIGTHRPRR